MKCPHCFGSGYFWVVDNDSSPSRSLRPCPFCQGKGKIDELKTNKHSEGLETYKYGGLNLLPIMIPDNQPSDSKPPLGIEPYWLFRSNRIAEILNGMCRFYSDGLAAPVEWVVELRKYIAELEAEASSGRK